MSLHSLFDLLLVELLNSAYLVHGGQCSSVRALVKVLCDNAVLFWDEVARGCHSRANFWGGDVCKASSRTVGPWHWTVDPCSSGLTSTWVGISSGQVPSQRVEREGTIHISRLVYKNCKA